MADEQMPATVTSASPLRVVGDGSTVDCPAFALNGATYTVGQRVQVTVRTPTPPLIQGEETQP